MCKDDRDKWAGFGALSDTDTDTREGMDKVRDSWRDNDLEELAHEIAEITGGDPDKIINGFNALQERSWREVAGTLKEEEASGLDPEVVHTTCTLSHHIS